jgi:hypothetical protein
MQVTFPLPHTVAITCTVDTASALRIASTCDLPTPAHAGPATHHGTHGNASASRRDVMWPTGKFFALCRMSASGARIIWCCTYPAPTCVLFADLPSQLNAIHQHLNNSAMKGITQIIIGYALRPPLLLNFDSLTSHPAA